MAAFSSYGRPSRAAPPPKAGVPPVTKSNDTFQTDEGKEISYLKAISSLQHQAYAQANAITKSRGKGRGKGGGRGRSFPVPQPAGPLLPSPPQFGPLINPFQAIIAGIGGQVSQAQGRVGQEQGQAQSALQGIGSPTQVPGISTADVGGAIQGSLAGQGSDISGSLRGQMAQFIIKQIQQRQQMQADYLRQVQSAQAAYQQQNAFSPSDYGQLVAAGIDPSTIDVNNPFAVQGALGKARASSGSSKLTSYGISMRALVDLVHAGINPELYRNDEEGARLAVAKQKAGPSDAVVNALLKAANS